MALSSAAGTDQGLPWPEQGASDARASYLPTTVAVVVGLAVLRLVALRFSVVDLFADEAQYWSWSRDLALGYYTKPPLLAWIIAASGHVCGTAEWCVRAPAPLFYAATSLVVYAIGRQLYDERTGFWAALLTSLATGIVFSARVISTDVPLLFFWALALWAYVNLLAHVPAKWTPVRRQEHAPNDESRARSDSVGTERAPANPSRRWALVLGASIGLGLLAKYAMIYLLPGMALAALLSPRARLLWMRSDIWLALAVAALVVAPNIAWNVSNSFATFHHTGGLIVGEPVRPDLMRGLAFLAAQFAVFGPVVFAVMFIETFRVGSRALREQDRILIAFLIPALAVVTGFAVAVKAYDNWAAVSFIPGVVLAAAILSRRDATGWMRLSIAIGVVAQVILIAGDTMADRLRLPYVGNPYHRTIGWRAFAEAAGAMAQAAGAKTIATESRSDYATLRYYLRDRPGPVLWWRTAELPDFELKRALTQSSPEPVLFVTGCPAVDYVRSVYADVVPLGPFTSPIGALPRGDGRVFYGFRLSGARGRVPPLERC